MKTNVPAIFDFKQIFTCYYVLNNTANKMEYTYVKLQSGDIMKNTWDTVKTKWEFWVPIVLSFLTMYPLFMISVIYYMIKANENRTSFWKEFAKVNNWNYKEGTGKALFGTSYTQSVPDIKAGLMLNAGNNGFISNQIEGVIGDRPFRIFCFQFSIGSGKNSRLYCYTVFGFKSKGSFPNIFLNTKNNTFAAGGGEKITLPPEFEEKFTLYAPRKYEIEALEIFTPDVMTKLIDNKFPYDVEFVNQEILIFADGIVNSFPELEICFNKSLELQDIFFERLSRFKFEQIGDLPTVLS